MSDDDDFMMDSDGDEETYDFEYESDEGSETNAQIDAENAYYRAKSLKEEDPLEAIESLKGVLVKEEEAGQKGDWGFKALKQICKISFNVLGDKVQTLQYYTLLLTYTKSAVTRNYSEKSLNNILDYISGAQSSDDSALVFMEQFYDLTLKSLEESNNSRLWLKTSTKLAKLYLDRKEFAKLTKSLKVMHDSCKNEDGTDDQTKGTQLLEIYALEIQMYTETKNNKKLADLYARTLKVKSAIPHPRIMGVIRECGAKMHMSLANYQAAQEDFFESFKNYDEAGSPQRIVVLKYLVLANMLMKSEINPFESQETKPFRSNAEVSVMVDLVDSYQRNDLVQFQKILKVHGNEIMSDKFIAQNISPLLENMRTSVLLAMIQSYSRVSLEFLGEELNISVTEVEDLVVKLIVDGKIRGRIDEVNCRLDLSQIKNDTSIEGQSASLDRYEVMVDLVDGVNSLWKNCLKRIAI